MAPKNKGESPVGFGKPPAHSRFKKGVSGNPKGRPKGSLNMTTVLARTLRETVTITENGRRSTITKLEAAVKQLTNKSATGDLGALRLLMDLVRSAEEKAESTSDNKPQTNEADHEVMLGILTKLKTHSGGSK